MSEKDVTLNVTLAGQGYGLPSPIRLDKSQYHSDFANDDRKLTKGTLCKSGYEEDFSA